MCWQILAARALKQESMLVYKALESGDIVASRRAVSMIVGRDTAALNDAAVTRAAVETVAENTSDGVVAPLLFLAIGGAPLGFFYKAVNTMDSMPVSYTHLDVYKRQIQVEDHQIYIDQSPLDMKYVYGFIRTLPPDMADPLSFVPYQPRWPENLDESRSRCV